jgi:hypothetical protein
MSEVIGYGIAGEESSHHCGKGDIPGAQQEVKMIRD